jgi:glycerol uptake operon antiterminator
MPFMSRVEIGSPVIPCIRDMNLLDKAIKADSSVTMFLSSDLNSLQDCITKVHDHRKKVYVNVDMLEGLAPSRAGIEYLSKCFKVDGIITTKHGLIKHACQLGLVVVQRFFAIDSTALEREITVVQRTEADIVEVMPGILPAGLLRELAERIKPPVITGGLIKTREDVVRALAAGVIGVTTSATELWNIDIEKTAIA